MTVWSVILLACLALGLVLAARRVAEFVCMRDLGSVREAFKMSPAQLRRRMAYTKRRQFRQANRLLITEQTHVGYKIFAWMIVGVKELSGLFSPWRYIGLIQNESFRRLVVHQALMRSMRLLDDIVDGDTKPSQGTREEYFKHVTRLFAQMQDLDEPLWPEDLGLVASVVCVARLRGIRFDIREAMNEISV